MKSVLTEIEPNHKKRTVTKKTSYGIIETVGGVFMARSYKHIQQYEKEIMELREQGLTLRQIGLVKNNYLKQGV